MLSQFGNVNVHAAPIEVIGVAPNGVECELPFEQCVLGLGQEEQQLVFLRGQPLGILAKTQFLAVVVVDVMNKR